MTLTIKALFFFHKIIFFPFYLILCLFQRHKRKNDIAQILLFISFNLYFSLTSSYQKNYVDTAGDVKHLFCNKVFSAWDYSIETEDAAKLRKIAFCNEIKVI